MPTVGEVLRTERERQGRTLKEISDALNIKRQYLAALEEDRYDDIPGVVFVKGFIRNYGNYLGMDGGALVDTYKASLTGRTPQPEVRAAMPVRRSKDKKRAKHKEAKKKGRNGKWPEITIIAGVILFLLLIVWIMI